MGTRLDFPTAASPFEPRYDLSPAEAHSMTQDFLETQRELQPGLTMGKVACYVIAGDDPMSNVSRYRERSDFEKAFGNKSQQMSEEYGRYEHTSEIVTVFNTRPRHEAPMGVLRLIWYTEETGLKALNDTEEKGIITPEQFMHSTGLKSLDTTCEVATLAVAPEYRGKASGYFISSLLYRAAIRYSLECGKTDTVAIMDAGARKSVKLTGIPLAEMEGTTAFEYLGSSQSYALHGKVPTFFDAINRRSAELSARTQMNILHPRRTARRLGLAKMTGSLGTGVGLDEFIMLPNQQHASAAA